VITVTDDQLQAISSSIPVGVADEVNRCLVAANCITHLRAAMLIGQMVVESNFFRATVEIGGARQRYAPFYGRGWLQLTWLKSYAACGQALGLDLVNNPDLVLSHNADVVGWYWNTNNLNNYADVGDADGCSTRINGPRITPQSLALRKKYYDRACSVLSGTHTDDATCTDSLPCS